MPRNKDNSPVPQTCPLIDWVINEVSSIYSSSEPMSGGENAAIETKMEKIRAANTELREWGNEEFNRANELEGELEDAKNEIADLKEEIQSLKDELKNVEA